MKKIKVKPLKRLRLPRKATYFAMSEASYAVAWYEHFEREQRRPFWENVLATLRGEKVGTGN